MPQPKEQPKPWPPVEPPLSSRVQAFMHRKQVEWTRRDVRTILESSRRRRARRALVPLDALERLLELAGA